MSEENGSMSLMERHELVEGYLGKVVTIEIDRSVYFQEKYYHTTVRSIDGSTAQISAGASEQ